MEQMVRVTGKTFPIKEYLAPYGNWDGVAWTLPAAKWKELVDQYGHGFNKRDRARADAFNSCEVEAISAPSTSPPRYGAAIDAIILGDDIAAATLDATGWLRLALAALHESGVTPDRWSDALHDAYRDLQIERGQ